MGTIRWAGLAAGLAAAGGCASLAQEFEPTALRTYASGSAEVHDPAGISGDDSSCDPGHGNYTDAGSVEVVHALLPTVGVGGSLQLYEHHIEEHVDLVAGTGAQTETMGLGLGIEARWAPLATRARPLTGLTFGASLWAAATHTVEAVDADADGLYDPREIHDRGGSAIGATARVGWTFAWGKAVRCEPTLGISHAIGDNPAGMTWLIGVRLGVGF